MKTLFKLFTIVFTIMFLVPSCTMEKRIYTSGYNLDWSSSNKKSNQKELLINENQTKSNLTNNSQSEISTNIVDKKLTTCNEALLASGDNSFISFKSNEYSSINLLEECDNIILKNGEEIKAKVIEITQDEIKYKKCDNLNGPIYSIKKVEVLIIKYFNGTKDIINISENNSIPKNIKQDGKRIESFSYASYFTSLLGAIIAFSFSIGLGILLCLAAIVLGVIGLIRIKKHSDIYKGRGFAILAIILSSLTIAVSVLLIALLVSM